MEIERKKVGGGVPWSSTEPGKTYTTNTGYRVLVARNRDGEKIAIDLSDGEAFGEAFDLDSWSFRFETPDVPKEYPIGFRDLVPGRVYEGNEGRIVFAVSAGWVDLETGDYPSTESKFREVRARVVVEDV